MRLLFDHGTLVLAEAPDINLDFVPGLLWDPRVALFRAPAHRYPEVVDALRSGAVPKQRISLTPPLQFVATTRTGPGSGVSPGTRSTRS